LFEKWAENLGKTVDIPVAICTDHPETPIGFLPVTVGAAMRGGLDFENALRSVTINPAKILGIDGRVGSIEVGKDADFQLYYSDNIFEILSKPIAVYLQGKVVN
jgi:imidazolonepropionase-like amidohydrolase